MGACPSRPRGRAGSGCWRPAPQRRRGARARPARVQRISRAAAARAEHVGHGVEQGADLGVAVAGALDRLGVQPERDVVDEHPAVDLGQVHPPLTAVDERLEGADDIVAVDAEVEREMVAGAGGHARVRQPELGGDRGDDRLRAVPTRHREPVRAALDRAADEHLEVVAGLQLDRLDPPRCAPPWRARSAPPSPRRTAD